MANMEKLNGTLRYIRTHMDLWDQTTWFKPIGDEFTSKQLVDMILEDPYDPACGVTGCMAGLAAFQNGYVPIFRITGDGDWAEVNPGEMVAYRDPNTGVVDKDNPLTAKEAAAAVFEIDSPTAHRLFDSDNTFEVLQAMVAHIGEHGNLTTFISPRQSECSCGDPNCSLNEDSYDEDYYGDDYDDVDNIF